MKTIKLENKITYYILSFSLYLLFFNKISLLSLISGTFISIIIILLFDKLNIYKFKLTKLILLIISIILLIYLLNKVSYFIGDNILKEYSIIQITFSFLLSIFILGNKGYHTIIKVLLISTYFIFFILIIGFLLLIPYIKIDNISITMLSTNNLFINTIIYILLNIYSYFLIYPITNSKIQKKDLIISNIFNIFTLLLINSILNILINYVKYPYVVIFKKVNLIGFIERIEIFFSLNYLYMFYFLLLFIYFQIRTILNIKFKKKKLNYILSILTIIIFLTCMII